MKRYLTFLTIFFGVAGILDLLSLWVGDYSLIRLVDIDVFAIGVALFWAIETKK